MWTFAEERPICWEEPPEQIAITNTETGKWDAYMRTSAAERMIREARNEANWLNAELHGAELEAARVERTCHRMTADDVRRLIERHSDEGGGNWRDFHNGAYVAIADELNTRAERTGRIKEDETGFLVCSECGAIQPEEWTVYYCWCCGAKVVE